jgi:hypothetical protein
MILKLCIHMDGQFIGHEGSIFVSYRKMKYANASARVRGSESGKWKSWRQHGGGLAETMRQAGRLYLTMSSPTAIESQVEQANQIPPPPSERPERSGSLVQDAIEVYSQNFKWASSTS